MYTCAVRWPKVRLKQSLTDIDFWNVFVLYLVLTTENRKRHVMVIGHITGQWSTKQQKRESAFPLEENGRRRYLKITFSINKGDIRARLCKRLRYPGIDSWRAGMTKGMLSHRPARLQRLAESILWNRFLGSLKKFGLWKRASFFYFSLREGET
jgi:hypothetical protein